MPPKALHGCRDVCTNKALNPGILGVECIHLGLPDKSLKFPRDKGIVLHIPENKEELDYVVMLQGSEIDTRIVGKLAWWCAKR